MKTYPLLSIIHAVRDNPNSTGFEIAKHIAEEYHSKHLIAFGTLYFALDKLTQRNILIRTEHSETTPHRFTYIMRQT
jgi:DNA-binding PadR family transcriptional regulator